MPSLIDARLLMSDQFVSAGAFRKTGLAASRLLTLLACPQAASPPPWLEAAQDDATRLAIGDMERAGIDRAAAGAA